MSLFENSSYLFNSEGLYLRFSTKRFVLDKEDFMTTLVWICMYFLHGEFWDEEIPVGIGNVLGHFSKVLKATKQIRNISYARICEYMNISKTLLELIDICY